MLGDAAAETMGPSFKAHMKPIVPWSHRSCEPWRWSRGTLVLGHSSIRMGLEERRGGSEARLH